MKRKREVHNKNEKAATRQESPPPPVIHASCTSAVN